MDLVERDGFLDLLISKLTAVASGEGHCVFVSGEAGIGKTSLVKIFCNELPPAFKIYQGTCDALFTPRPLAPLYDIIWQVRNDVWKTSTGMEERTTLFSDFFQELNNRHEPSLIVFEDIHWADEATLDFIKFFIRRIARLRCLFLLTYRDNEIHLHHPLRNVFGQLPADSFTRLQLPPLSLAAVEKMAVAKGFNGMEVFTISGGNPFYVNEILASYSPGIPDNIKDSILFVYNNQDADTRHLWEILSVMPAGLEISFLEKMDPAFLASADKAMDARILVLRDGLISFKHELYRRTIEASLSPLLRLALNKKILVLFLDNFKKKRQTERIIHHAKNANEYELIVQYAPAAAKEAAAVGAHIEACRLYLSAIEYYQGSDKDLLAEFFEAYAYECYLSNQTKDAIIYTGKAMQFWKEKGNVEKTGNSLRFLSRLWWFEGNRMQAEQFAVAAIEALEAQPLSRVKAMAFSNMSQLKMLSKETESTIFWGEKAIAMAAELDDEEIMCHALNNVGTVLAKTGPDSDKGLGLLQQSLGIALKHDYGEHVARAYTNLGSNSVVMKNYAVAGKMLNEGIHYCEEKGLDSWTAYMLSWKARLLLETGNWKEAFNVADNLLKNDNQPPVVKISTLAVMATLKMRQGDIAAVPLLLEAEAKAFEAMELQRIIPAVVALLEYEWITGKSMLQPHTIEQTLALARQRDNSYEDKELLFWLSKARKQFSMPADIGIGYDISNETMAVAAAAYWEKIGCPYEQALTLFDAGESGKRKALAIVQALGATAVMEKMKMQMRSFGIKNIPRGIRKTTQANAALLTQREVDVLYLLKENMQNKEIAARLFISAKTVDHHISSILFKLNVNARNKAVREALRMQIIK